MRQGVGCSEASSGVAEMRQSFRGAKLPRPPETQFVTNFTIRESSAFDSLSEFSDDLSRRRSAQSPACTSTMTRSWS